MKTTKHAPAKIRSASFNADANTIDVTWSTGADVQREDYNGTYVERLLMGQENVRLDRLNSGAPFLDVHNSGSLGDVIGVVVGSTARIENGKGLATIKLSSAATDADVVQKIRDGVIKNVSVGYWVHSSTRVEGEKGQPDVVVCDDWEPLEISAVPIPADAGAQIRSAQRRKTKPLSKEQRDFQAGAAQASRLLGNAPVPISKEQARGAAAARSLKAGKGNLRVEGAKPATFDPAEIARGARVARKLLRTQK
jgi:HK97 family phage prohead protease